ncbi:MAG: hypothetical protein JWP75_3534 [Frondihabitans sp.]|nr:hypothetical protein [Frondihabitans sp.]
MARTVIPITRLVTGGVVPTPPPVAIDAVDGMTVPALPAGPWVLWVSNTDVVNAHTVVLAAGDPVLCGGAARVQSFTVPASSASWLGPFQSSVCEQADGSVSFNFDVAHTGSVYALNAAQEA